nr:hypothetical protein [Tanacetum cinerariifolium]
NIQRVLDLSLKEQAERTQGSARPVVIREPDSGRFQPLLEIQGKVKEKAVEEQAAHDLLTLQTLKNKIPVDQFIFQRRIPIPAEASRPAESPSLDAELALTDSETESEGEAGPNPGVQDEGQAGSNPGDAAGSQPQSSHVVHVGPNLKPMDLEATDATHLQTPKQLNEDFTDQFFVEKQQEEEPRKTNAKVEVQSMVSVLIHQDTSSVPLMTTPVIDLTTSQSSSLLPTSSTTTSTEAQKYHKKLYDALEKSLERNYSDQLLSDLEEARQKKRKRRNVPRTPSGSPPPQPPPPPPPSKCIWCSSCPHLLLLHLLVHLSDDEDSENDHLPIADSRKGWWKPLPAEERPPTSEPTWTIPSSNTGDMTNFLNWFRHQVNKTKLTQADLEGQAYKVVKAFYPDVINLQFQMEECHKISKMKTVSYPDFGLELFVPEQMWIEDVCTYDINEKYGISHWWFNRQKLYIDRHESPSHRKEVRSHMRILSVVRIKAFSRYGYDYLSEIVLRRADLQEHTISKKDFKNLHPSDFKDLNLLLLQGCEFKHDYSIIESLRAIVFLVNNNERKIMRFNEIYKFSDGTLTWILEALAYRIKEFKIKRLNPGMNTRFWTEKDVTRSKEFIEAIERRLKTRRIYQNLECFVGRRVRTDFFREWNDIIIPFKRDNLIVSVEVFRDDYKRSNVRIRE